MSGISNNPSVDPFQSQLNKLDIDFSNIEGEFKKLEAANQNVVKAYNDAKAEAQKTVDWYNKQGFQDTKGNTLTFKTMQECFDRCNAGGVCDSKGTLINKGNSFYYPVTVENLKTLKAAETAYMQVMGPTLDKLNEAKTKLDVIGTGLKESITALKAMTKLLESGDIEGAVMMLQTNRSKVLEQQLGARIEGMQARNAQIKSLNDQLKVEQGKLATVTGTAEQKQAARDNINATITGLKGDMDKLNSDSQLDMIGIQGLVNKRNEAFDMLTNLLGKFQKTIDGIVGNMR